MSHREHLAHRLPRRLRLALLSLLPAAGALALAGGLVVATPGTASAQERSVEEQAQQVERQLLCPTCTNERLDVCGLAICRDMKRIIRERLEAGSTPDDIILFFETRYGPKVRAELEPEGFNLWLYGWLVATTGAVAVLGGWFLLRLRRAARPAEAVDAHDPDGDDPPR